MNSISRKLQDDPFPWALWRAAGRTWRKLVSALLARIFRAPGLYLGKGCDISGVRHIRFGRNFYVSGGLWLSAIGSYREQRFTPAIEIGDDVSLSVGVHISAIEHVAIGNGVLMGSHVYIADHNHGKYKGEGQSNPGESPAERRLSPGGAVVIAEKVFIGDNAVILGPARIGKGAVVGANSFVTGDVPEHTLVAGSPARPIKQFDPQSGTWQHVNRVRLTIQEN